MTPIAVDAMGGDRAPDEVVAGALEAASRGVPMLLVGRSDALQPLLPDPLPDTIELVDAPEVIEMGEDPTRALRDKKDSSIAVAARLVREGRAGGMMSAGSTGAAMAAAALIIGRLPGVRRPAIASIFPTGKIVLDSGANLEVKVRDLVQFAAMGTALAREYLGMASPRVGLVNIGEEPTKGRELEREAHRALSEAAGVRFVGNVEGRDIGTDTADVFVTDGFTGNVLLKTAEGTARMIVEMIVATFASRPAAAGNPEVRAGFEELRRRIDPEQIGGAHLLGVDGVVVIAHGSSSRVAIANAIEMAHRAVSDDLVGHVRKGLEVATPDGDGG